MFFSIHTMVPRTLAIFFLSPWIGAPGLQYCTWRDVTASRPGPEWVKLNLGSLQVVSGVATQAMHNFNTY